MNKKNLLWALVLAMGCLGSTASMAEQSESPVACVEGVEPLNLVYGDHTTGCNIDTPTDLDRFIFDGSAGDKVRIQLRSLTAGLDPRIEIREPGGAVIKDTLCTGSDVFGNPLRCSIVFDMTLGLSGQHQISISDSGANETGDYQFQLEIIPPNITPPGIVYGSTESDLLNLGVDMDFFEFNVEANSDIRVTVSSQTPGLDPRLEVWDQDGTVIKNTSCTGSYVFGNPLKCIFTYDLNIVLPGTYLLAVSDVGANEGGNFDVSLECLFGPCPGVIATRPECDIQMSQVTYIDGETVTADVFRLANLTVDPLSIELKIWLGLPDEAIPVINLGADGTFVLPAGTDVDLGPLTLMPVNVELPRGGFEFSCRMLDPTTGRLLMEDRNFFDIQ